METVYKADERTYSSFWFLACRCEASSGTFISYSYLSMLVNSCMFTLLVRFVFRFAEEAPTASKSCDWFRVAWLFRKLLLVIRDFGAPRGLPPSS